MSHFRESEFEVLATGLRYPEGPVWRPGGSVLLVEIAAGTLTRIAPGGARQVVAQLGGGPNGAAIGPGGAVYVCNDGGLQFLDIAGLSVASDQPANYQGGSIQRVDGPNVETICTQFLDAAGDLRPLRGPDDLVFDVSGGFWFTDWGKTACRKRDITGIYYMQPPASAGAWNADGRQCSEKAFPLSSPNGIGLSPDGARLYVAETYTRRILYWNLSGPGQIDPNPRTFDGSWLLTAEAIPPFTASGLPGQGTYDSMALDAEGNLYVATLLPEGPVIDSKGGIAVISPRGKLLEFLEIDAGPPSDPLPSNICFGGEDLRTAFITLGGTGRLVSCRMRVPGLKLAFS